MSVGISSADVYSRHNSLQQKFAADAWFLFSSKVTQSPFGDVIDMGCGSGETTFALAHWVAEFNENLGHGEIPNSITGIDVSPTAIELCRQLEVRLRASKKLGPTVSFEFLKADIGHAFCLSSNWKSHFDLVTCFESAHWIKDQNQVLANVAFCLKKGGRFVTTSPLGFACEFQDGKNIPDFTNYMKDSKYSATVEAGIRLLEKWGAFLPPGGMCQAVFPGIAAFNDWGVGDPIYGYKRMAEKVSLRVDFAGVLPFSYTFSSEEEFVGMIESFCSHIGGIPESRWTEFARDYVAEFRRVCRWIVDEAGKKRMVMDEPTFIVIGEKY